QLQGAGAGQHRDVAAAEAVLDEAPVGGGVAGTVALDGGAEGLAGQAGGVAPDELGALARVAEEQALDAVAREGGRQPRRLAVGAAAALAGGVGGGRLPHHELARAGGRLVLVDEREAPPGEALGVL